MADEKKCERIINMVSVKTTFYWIEGFPKETHKDVTESERKDVKQNQHEWCKNDPLLHSDAETF